MEKSIRIGKALTWNELANLYDMKHSSGRPARILPMDRVFSWAERQKDRFHVDSENGTIHKIEER